MKTLRDRGRDGREPTKLWLARRFVRGRVGFIVFTLTEMVLPVLVAYLSYRLVERPFLRLKDRFAGTDGRAPTSAVLTAGPGVPSVQ